MTDSSGSKISRITIAGLEDIGYKVDYSQADLYTANDMDPSCRCNGTSAQRHLWMADSDNCKPAKRRLSDEGRRKAMQHGKRILAERKQRRMSRSASGRTSNNIVSVGHEAVSVLYREGNEIYSVMVKYDS